MTILEIISHAIQDIVGSDVHFSVTFQEVSGRGDYSSNVAMILANASFHSLPTDLSSMHSARKNPREIAQEISNLLLKNNNDVFDSIVVAAPGFLNFFLKDEFLYAQIIGFLNPQKKVKTGKASVEFISANPTGPLHIGNARGGPIGDTIANVLQESGWKVKREYFYNDAGAQIGKFADALWHWYALACGELSAPDEIQYRGPYVNELIAKAKKKFTDTLMKRKNGKETLLKFAFGELDKENFETIEKMGIHFDKVTYESKLKNKTKKVLAELKKKNLLKEKEGAVWFVPKDENLKEREVVVQKSDGTFLYFANDIAYHKKKFSENDLVIDVLGEGHHGHIPKLRAIADVFKFQQENFHVIVSGQVNLLRGGKRVSMSKREGNFVTAREVLDEVGRDAFRFFFLQYSPRTAMNFDLNLARERSKKNPVYYIQYAHARASSILRKYGKRAQFQKARWEALALPQELALLKRILSFTEQVEDTARDFEVQRLARYAYELARAFTDFYENVRVIGEERECEAARIALTALTKRTLARALGLLGVSAPDEM